MIQKEWMSVVSIDEIAASIFEFVLDPDGNVNDISSCHGLFIFTDPEPCLAFHDADQLFTAVGMGPCHFAPLANGFVQCNMFADDYAAFRVRRLCKIFPGHLIPVEKWHSSSLTVVGGLESLDSF